MVHAYREEIIAIGDDPALRAPPPNLEASEIYRCIWQPHVSKILCRITFFENDASVLFCCRELQEALFYDKEAVDRGVDLRLRPGGRVPGDKPVGPSKPITVGPPGVMQPSREGPAAWKDDSWRSPFKGDWDALTWPVSSCLRAGMQV